MKSPLLIGVSALILLASASFLFAQTTTGSSLITEMKAAVRSFTLAGQLNPGITGLQSAPVSGKVTGDMLTAGEYNRILELVGQGGGGGGKFEINDSTTKTSYYLSWTGSAWDTLGTGTAVVESCPGYTHCAKLDTAAHDFCMIRHSGGSSPHVALTYIGAKKYSLQTSTSGSSSIAVICYDNIGTGGTGGGGGFNWDMCVAEWGQTRREGIPYTNAAGLKCKYTGNGFGNTNLNADANFYYLCCPGA